MSIVESFIYEFEPHCYEKYYFDQVVTMKNESYFSNEIEDEQETESQLTLDDLERYVI